MLHFYEEKQDWSSYSYANPKQGNLLKLVSSIWIFSVCKSKTYKKASTELKSINLHYIINWIVCSIFLWRILWAIREAHWKNWEPVTALYLVLPLFQHVAGRHSFLPSSLFVTLTPDPLALSGLSGDAAKLFYVLFPLHIHTRAIKNQRPINLLVHLKEPPMCSRY